MVIAKECWSFFVHFCVDFEVCLAHLSLLSVAWSEPLGRDKLILDRNILVHS